MRKEETPKTRVRKKRKQRADQLFPEAEWLDNNKIICARCLEEKDYCKSNSNFCRPCYSHIVNVRQQIVLERERVDYMNKWNVKDIYCNTVIRHHEKEFRIGTKVDEKTEKYLTAIGYGFIFKEVSEQ